MKEIMVRVAGESVKMVENRRHHEPSAINIIVHLLHSDADPISYQVFNPFLIYLEDYFGVNKLD